MSRIRSRPLGLCLLLAASALLAGLAPIASAADDPRDAKIAAALESPTFLDCTETPLTLIVEYLGDFHSLQIQVDTMSLEQAKVSTDSPITKKAKDTSFAKVLDEILKPLKLDYIIKDHMLTITTAEAAKELRKAQAKEKK